MKTLSKIRFVRIREILLAAIALIGSASSAFAIEIGETTWHNGVVINKVSCKEDQRQTHRRDASGFLETSPMELTMTIEFGYDNQVLTNKFRYAFDSERREALKQRCIMLKAGEMGVVDIKASSTPNRQFAGFRTQSYVFYNMLKFGPTVKDDGSPAETP